MNDGTKPKRIVCKTPEESFAFRTERRGDCLIWTGAVKDTGYGAMWDGSRVVRPHRWAYEQHHGPIPAGTDIDHICGVRVCCEITHLRVATRKQNMENLRTLNSNNASGARGVSWDRTSKKWRVRVKHNYREVYGGLFDNVEDAQARAIELRDQLFTHNDSDHREDAEEAS